MSVLEVVLLILVILFFLIVFLLIIPLGVVASYHGDFNELTLKIRVWFVNIKFDIPQKSKKKVSDKTKKQVEEQQTEAKTEKEAGDTSKKTEKQTVKKLKNNFNKYLPLIKLVPPTIYRLIEKIVFDDIYIIWYVKSGNAADSAIAAGKMYAAFYSAYAAITPPFNIRLKDVRFEPDFLGSDGINNYINVRVSTRLILIIIVALWFLIAMKDTAKQR